MKLRVEEGTENGSAFSRVKAEVSIAEYAESKGAVFRDSGNGYLQCSCIFPEHKDRNPSFTVYRDSNRFYCYGCGRGGSVIDLEMKLSDVSNVQALRAIAEYADIDIGPVASEEEIQKTEMSRSILQETANFYHSQLFEPAGSEVLRYLTEERGRDEATMKRFMIGAAAGGLGEHLETMGFAREDCIECGVLSDRGDFFYGGVAIYPHIVNGDVVAFTQRDPSGQRRHRLGKHDHFYNQDAMKGSDSIIIVEGENDLQTVCQLSNSRNVIAICGSGVFGDRHIRLLKRYGVKSVYLCLDNDEAGREAAKKMTEMLRREGFLVYIMGFDEACKDIDEHLRKVEDPARVFQDLIAHARRTFRIHLMDIEKAEHSGSYAEIDVMVTAIGETFHVPKTFTAKCLKKQCSHIKDGKTCPLNDGDCAVEIPDDSDKLISFTRTGNKTVDTILRELSPCPLGMRSRDDIIFHDVRQVSVQELLVIPKASRVITVTRNDEQVDANEFGREYKDKLVFYLGTLSKSNKYYRAKGWVKSSPKSQQATFLIRELESLSDDCEGFTTSDEVIQGFGIFQPQMSPDSSVAIRKEAISRKIGDILRDLTDNVTQIYGDHRERSLLAQLLVYHSIVQFSFDGEPLKRGWVEILIVGDSGQGKTQMFDRLQQFTGMGEFIGGSSATRTGIAYSFQTIGSTWFLKWGKYPLNDGRLLFIDEGQTLDVGDWDKLSSGRSDGVLVALGVQCGEHNSRTRLIVSANPKSDVLIDDKMFGAETVKSMFRIADIRRFDLAILLSGSDQDCDVVDRLSEDRHPAEQQVTSEALSNSIKYAWTRKMGDVEFTEEASRAVIEVTKRLKSKYEAANDIPLISTDARHTVARLSVALACLLHSADDTHQRVIVHPEHVLYIEDFIDSIYSFRNCSLDTYAAIRRKSSELDEKEYLEFLKAISKETDGETVIPADMVEVLVTFSQYEEITRQELASILGIEPKSVSTKLKPLRDRNLIKHYSKTPKFIKILKRMIIDDIIKI